MVRLVAMLERKFTDDDILAAVTAVRAQKHACTLTALAAHMGVPKTTLVHYTKRLREAGDLGETEVTGSLHVTR